MTDEELERMLREATPGPWRRVNNPASGAGERADTIYGAGSRGHYVADVYHRYLFAPNSEEEFEANANLTTAAPDLAAEVLRLRGENAALHETNRELVKPLEWHRVETHGGVCYDATAMGLQYRVGVWDGQIRVNLLDHSLVFGNGEAAKAAAQADYEARIRSALMEPEA